MITDKITKENVTCPVCDSRNYQVKYEPWLDVTDPVKLYGATSGIQGTQRLVLCSDCGAIYENPRYPQEIIIKGYQSYAEAAHDSQHQMRVKSFYGGLKAIEKYLPPRDAKVLDVGTAGGGFLEAARQFGYDAVGLEPSEFMVEQGNQRGLNIIAGTLDDDLFPSASFDMVCLWDVLEHLADPKAALQAVHKILKPDGVLLINYPDIGTQVAKLAGKNFWWILSVHLVHFNKQSITKVCDLTGFEVFHYQPYWQTLEFGYLEEMAIILKVPFSKLLKRLTPAFLQHIPIPYYASQTTVLAHVKKIERN